MQVTVTPKEQRHGADDMTWKEETEAEEASMWSRRCERCREKAALHKTRVPGSQKKWTKRRTMQAD